MKRNELKRKCHFQRSPLRLIAEACFCPQVLQPLRHCCFTAVFLVPQNGSLCTTCLGPQGWPHMTAGHDQYPAKVQSKLPPSLEQGSQRCLYLTLKSSMQLATTTWTCSAGSEPFHQVRQGLGKGSQSKHRAQCPTPQMQWHECPEGPCFPGGDSTEETMDVSGPAQEQETSSCKGTRARDELI